MTTPPTRPEPFDPRDYPDPLQVEPARPTLRQIERQYSADWGCGTILGLLCALVLVALIAAPRSAPDPTASQPGGPGAIDSVDVPAQVPASSSGPELSGAPHEREGWTPTGSSPMDRHDGGASQPRAEAPVPPLSGAIISGWASWYGANGDVASVPWWKPGQDPVWAAISRFADGKTYAVTVLIVGFCQCYVGTDQERVIDLSDDAFRQLYDTRRPDPGLLKVTIELLDAGPGLPATDQ